MHRGEVSLTPLLGPLHRAAEGLREVPDQELLCINLELAAEATADLRRDHAHLVLREPEAQRGDELHEVWDLRRRPERELPCLELGCGRAGLHRVRDETLVDQVQRDFHLRVPEGLVDVPALHRIGEDEVRPELLVDDRRARLERLGRVDHDGERLVIHRDCVRRALRGVAGLGHDRRDGIAGVPDLIGRDRHVLRGALLWDRDEDRQHAGGLEVLTGQHRDHAGLLRRR